MGLTYGNSLFGLTPVGAGYSSVVPSGASAGAFPIGLGTTSNNQYGGQSFSMPGASVPQTPVWAPPTSGNTANGGLPSIPTNAPSTQFGTGAVTPSAGAVPMTAAAGGASGAGGGNFLDGILQQIQGGAGYSAIPPMPAMPGVSQGVQNLMNYQQYMQQLSNQNNQANFQMAAGALQGAGTTAMTDAQNAAQQQTAQMTQGTIDRGLTNSTIPDTLNRGIQTDLSYNQQRIQEGEAQQLINLLQQRQTGGPTNNPLIAQLIAQASNQPNLSLMNGYGYGGGVTHSYLNTFMPGNAYSGSVGAY